MCTVHLQWYRVHTIESVLIELDTLFHFALPRQVERFLEERQRLT